MLLYLDSSAIVKRYLEERGSNALDTVYEGLESEEHRAAFSVWNLGEVVGAIDTRAERGDLDERSRHEALRLLMGETRKFAAMRRITLLPVGGSLLEESRDLIVKHHIYQADALQLATARLAESGLFLTADRRLAACAKTEGFEVANPESDQRKIAALLAQ